MRADPSLQTRRGAASCAPDNLRFEAASPCLAASEAVSRPSVLVFVPVWILWIPVWVWLRVWIAVAVSEPAVARVGAPALVFAGVVVVLERVFAAAPVAVVGAVVGLAVVSLRPLFVFAVPVAAVVVAAAGAGVLLAVVSASRNSAADVAAGAADSP